MVVFGNFLILDFLKLLLFRIGRKLYVIYSCIYFRVDTIIINNCYSIRKLLNILFCLYKTYINFLKFIIHTYFLHSTLFD